LVEANRTWILDAGYRLKKGAGRPVVKIISYNRPALCLEPLYIMYDTKTEPKISDLGVKKTLKKKKKTPPETDDEVIIGLIMWR
jgi:hypothetical protein